jgi:hypothetical protein
MMELAVLALLVYAWYRTTQPLRRKDTNPLNIDER